jgi:tRNA(fMet)-specific endonuclease VapC
MIILDTDVLSVLEWSSSSPKAKHLAERLDGCGEAVVTTIVCVEEQMRGWLASLSRKRTLKDQVEAYRRLRRQVDNLLKLAILDFDEPAAVKFQTLRKAMRRLGTMDLKIAAIALVHDGTIVTGNLSDYQQVPGLKIQHWEKL